MKTDDLITMLSSGPDVALAARPVRATALPLLGGLLASAALMLAILGLRPDLGLELTWPAFWLKLVFSLALAGAGGFAVKRSSSYDVSDAALLPGGDLLLLERKFSWTSGLSVRIRRIALSEIKPGVTVDGPVLFEADLGYEIDNMEGLSVHRSPAGETVLTLISDDNFLPFQRTLLLQFTLAEP